MGHKTIKLFCIPFSGGNAYSYAEFKKYLPDHIELCNLELPGRGKRIAEELLTSIDTMTEDLFRQVESKLEGNYVIFGHSLGALQGLTLCRHISARKAKTDFQSIANYKYASSSLPLNIPIAVLLGNQENVNEEDAAYWQLETEIEIAILITNKCNQLI